MTPTPAHTPSPTGASPNLALSAYDALLARSPGNVDVLRGRGIVCARLGRWPEAERDLRVAAAASPAYTAAGRRRPKKVWIS